MSEDAVASVATSARFVVKMASSKVNLLALVALVAFARCNVCVADWAVPSSAWAASSKVFSLWSKTTRRVFRRRVTRLLTLVTFASFAFALARRSGTR